jgi:hypothetical protein
VGGTRAGARSVGLVVVGYSMCDRVHFGGGQWASVIDSVGGLLSGIVIGGSWGSLRS